LKAVPAAQPPHWIERLQTFHFRGDPRSKYKFFIRYQAGGGLYSLPSVSEVQAGVQELEQYVSSVISGT
jgi:hypothetical protein